MPRFYAPIDDQQQLIVDKPTELTPGGGNDFNAIVDQTLNQWQNLGNIIVSTAGTYAFSINDDASSAILADVIRLIPDDVLKVVTPIVNNVGPDISIYDELSLDCATVGAIIYYTLDNSSPKSSFTRIEYKGEIFKLPEGNVPLRVYAELTDYINSDTLAIDYVVSDTPITTEPWITSIAPTGNLAIGDIVYITLVRGGSTEGKVWLHTNQSDPLSGYEQQIEAWATTEISFTVTAPSAGDYYITVGAVS